MISENVWKALLANGQRSRLANGKGLRPGEEKFDLTGAEIYAAVEHFRHLELKRMKGLLSRSPLMLKDIPHVRALRYLPEKYRRYLREDTDKGRVTGRWLYGLTSKDVFIYWTTHAKKIAELEACGGPYLARCYAEEVRPYDSYDIQ